MSTVTSNIDITRDGTTVTAEHTITIPADPDDAFELARDVTLWPEFMPAVTDARFVAPKGGGDVVEITADFNGAAHKWSSERDIDRAARIIRFKRRYPESPLSEATGAWEFRAVAGGCEIVLTHAITTITPEAGRAYAAATRSNATRDLEGIAEYLSGPNGGPLAGKVALITGGTRGIGAACAKALADMDAAVAITGTTRDSVDRGVSDLKDAGVANVTGYIADVRSQDSIDAMFGQVLADHGHVDILVNNAGIGGGGRTAEVPYADWDRIIDTNLNGAFRVTHTWLNRSGALERGWGRIINIASTGGKQGVRFAVAYSSSKHGVVGMAKALSYEVAEHGITVNAVCPGFVDTDLQAGSRRRYAQVWDITEDEVLTRQNARYQLGRLVRPEEVARQVAFLADPASAAITGQAMNVCGGLGLY